MGMHSYQRLVSMRNFLTGNNPKCWPPTLGMAHYARSTQAQSSKEYHALCHLEVPVRKSVSQRHPSSAKKTPKQYPKKNPACTGTWYRADTPIHNWCTLPPTFSP